MSRPNRPSRDLWARSPWLKMPFRQRVAWAVLYVVIVTVMTGVPIVVAHDWWTTAPLIGLWAVFVSWAVALAVAPAKAPRVFVVAATICLAGLAIAWLILLAQPVDR